MRMAGKGKSGSKSGNSKNIKLSAKAQKHSGNTGKMPKNNGSTGRIHTGNTGRIHTGNTGRIHTGNTAGIHTGSTGRIPTGNTGNIQKVDFGKTKNTLAGLGKLKRIRILLAIFIVVAVAGGALFLIEGFKIRCGRCTFSDRGL